MASDFVPDITEQEEEEELLRIKLAKEKKEAEDQQRKSDKQKLSSQNIVSFQLHEERDLRILDAVRRGDNELVHQLVEEGANFDTFDTNGTTPLHLAASQDESIMRFLCWNGAYVRCEDVWRRTPLHYACINGYTTLPLVQGGALLSNYDVDGFMPIHYAAFHGRPTCIDELIDRMQRPAAFTLEGKTILHLAVRQGHVQCVNSILAHRNIPAMSWLDIDRRTPLHDAIEVNNLDLLKLLVKRGFRLNFGDRWENTPMHTAAIWGRTRILRYMILDERHQIDEVDTNGWNVLHWACASGSEPEGNLDFVLFLLSRNADANAATNDGSTPLMISVLHRRNAIVEHLVKVVKVDISKRNSKGETALQIAAASGNDPAAAWLYHVTGHKMNIIKSDPYKATITKPIPNNGKSMMTAFKKSARMKVASFKPAKG